MNCEDVLLAVSQLADGELSGAECARIEAHLEQCLACRDAFLRQRELSDELREALAVPGARLSLARERIEAAIREAPEPTRRPSAGRIALAAAAVVVASVVGWAVVRGVRKPAIPTRPQGPAVPLVLLESQATAREPYAADEQGKAWERWTRVWKAWMADRRARSDVILEVEQVDSRVVPCGLGWQ